MNEFSGRCTDILQAMLKGCLNKCKQSKRKLHYIFSYYDTRLGWLLASCKFKRINQYYKMLNFKEILYQIRVCLLYTHIQDCLILS